MDNNHDKFLCDSIDDVYTPICFTCKYWHGKSGDNDDKFRCVAYPHGIPIGIMNGNLDHHKNLPGDNGVHWESAG